MKSPRLVESGLLNLASSTGGAAERYRRGETPHTIHVWWARRPHSAMRALVFSALASADDPESYELLSRVAGSSLLPPALLADVRKLIRRSWPDAPRVLDMFGGGGTIPFEAASLGAETYSIDSNELSVFLQKTLLHDAAKVRGLGELVAASGAAVLKRLAKASGELFPLRDTAFAYLWSYSLPCSKCNYEFLLAKRPWLSKKGRKRTAIEIVSGKHRDTAAIVEVGDDYELKSAWTGRGVVTCPKCGAASNSPSIATAKDALVVVIRHGAKSGKVFSKATATAMPERSVIDRVTKNALKSLKAELPSSELPRWSGIVNPALYGIKTHADFVAPRQRAVLLLLLKELRDEYQSLLRTHAAETARAVIAVLSGLVDQLVDWNCRLSMWISQNEQVGRAFSGPGVPMLWDYAELDPASDGPANLYAKLQRLTAGAEVLANLAAPVTVQKAFAQKLPFDDEFFDAIVTDPPYYDNLYYNVLADFFYAWKRLLFKEMESGLFKAPTTDSSRELVASTFRSGSSAQAHVDYCREFASAVAEAARVLKDDGVFSLVYSHSTVRGWEAILQAYRSAPLEVTSVQPLCIERKARPRAMTSAAVNTCVVFNARRRKEKRKTATRAQLRSEILRHCKGVSKTLSDARWNDNDLGLALFAIGVGIASNFAEVRGLNSDEAVILEIASAIQTLVPAFKVVRRKSL